MRLFLLFLFGFFPVAATLGQQTRHIHWEKNTPLRWAHFQGTPEAGDRIHGAVTYAGIEVQVEKVHFPGGEIQFKAWAVFDQKRSWVKEGRPDSLLLAHEQLHFDITEVYARKLTKKLNSLQLRKKDKALVKLWQNRYREAQLVAQELYDEESVHGLHLERQQAWRNLIDAELKQTHSRLQLQHESYTTSNRRAE